VPAGVPPGNAGAVLLPPAPQAFNKLRHATSTAIAPSRRTGFDRRTLVRPPSATADAKAVIGVGCCGTRGNGPPIAAAVAAARAVVVTETVNATALAVFTAADAGDTVQVACVGAPLHASETDPVNPPRGFTCRLKFAACPAVTSIEVDPPLAASNEKSGVATVTTAVFEVTPPCAATMFAVPAAMPLATPAVLMVATALFDDVHVAVLDRF
jgi:hypothetical protein